jgi:uncharacterized lipoprotein YddW (UPF0748 family)
MPRARMVIALFFFLIALALPAAAQSRRGEMRGAWMGDGYNRDWPAIMKSLQENGFNALFPNFCVGDMAYYPSKVLPVAKGAAPGRDELAEAIKAAKQHGIELHVWRISWALRGVPQDIIAQLEVAGRLQRNAKGELARQDPKVGVDWLCPSNPENRKLEKDAMLELVRNYDIAGIQFDYMRFPSGDYCFCDHCKAQFQKEANVTVSHWPEDVQEGGPYVEQWRAWRRGLITSLAEEISEECHRIKPRIFVSLAAWPDLKAAYDVVGQDWTSWVKAGVLDFVCPMDYTASRDDLVNNQLTGQLAQVQGIIPFYPGLGAFLMQSASQLITQVRATRELGADGFLAFAYFSGDLDKWLPDLRATVTATDPNPMPHWSPPARFSFKGPAAAPLSPREGASQEAWQVLAGKQLETELTLGIALPSGHEQAGEGAAQAADVLRQATNPRSPVTSYEPAPEPPLTAGEQPRISGRAVVETPDGLALGALGAFDGEMGVPRTFRVVVPEGPFRIAVYGAVVTGDRRLEFVARSILLTGTAEQPRAQKPELEEELARRCDEIRASIKPEQLAGLNGSLQVHATGPGGGDWWVRFRDGKIERGAGKAESPDVTVTASAADFVAMSRQQAKPRVLWEAGRLTIAGDPSVFQRLGPLLGYTVP